MTDIAPRSNRKKGRFLGRLGQSMLEAIIASGIVATAVSSALTLVQVSISAEKESEGGIVAANLAREGIEVVRSIRDSNWLAGADWDQGLEGADNDHTAIAVFSPKDNAWHLDFTPNDIGDPATRVYRYTTGTDETVVGLQVQALTPPDNTMPTAFSRLLALDAICDDAGTREVKESGAACAGTKIGYRVRSTVNFSVSGRPRSLEVEESIYDWR